MITAYSNNNTNFSGRKRNIVAAVVGAACLGGGVYTRAVLQDPYITESTGHEKFVSRQNDWGQNTRILAAVGQNSVTASSYNDSYSGILLKTLDKSGVSNIEQANDSLSKKGYQIKERTSLWDNLFSFGVDYLSNAKKFYSISTHSPKIHIFDKHDTTKTRFALFCSLKDPTENFEAETQEFADKVQRKFDIPDSNVVKISTTQDSDFVRAIDSISAKIAKVKNSKKVELMVYYNGHGDVKDGKVADKKIEGRLDGIILDNLTKKQVKKLFHEKLKNIKTLFILDACHSGAWISSVKPTHSRFLA